MSDYVDERKDASERIQLSDSEGIQLLNTFS